MKKQIPTKKPKVITQDMVGMKITTCLGNTVSEETNEFRVYIILDEVSDEGLDIFGINEDNSMDWIYKNNILNPVI